MLNEPKHNKSWGWYCCHQCAVVSQYGMIETCISIGSCKSPARTNTAMCTLSEWGSGCWRAIFSMTSGEIQYIDLYHVSAVEIIMKIEGGISNRYPLRTQDRLRHSGCPLLLGDECTGSILSLEWYMGAVNFSYKYVVLTYYCMWVYNRDFFQAKDDT